MSPRATDLLADQLGLPSGRLSHSQNLVEHIVCILVDLLRK